MVSAMTYVLIIFVWHQTYPAVTHIDGYRSLRDCQAALTQISTPAPVRFSAICINGPEKASVF